MLKRIFILVVLLVAVLLMNTSPVLAQVRPENVYVDESRSTGNEDGTMDRPYNTEKEGRAYAQSLPSGAYIYVRNPDGTWPSTPSYYILPVYSGASGAPISTVTLYVILAVLAVVLILLGWLLQRRARDLRG